MTRSFMLRAVATVVVALAVAAATGGMNAYWLRVTATALNFACVALAWGVLLGFAGQLHFAPAAIWGAGGYVAALLTARLGVDVWLALPAAAAVGAVLGAILVLPASRLQNIYLGLFTLAFGELLRLIATNEERITNGPSGLGLSRVQFPFGLQSVPQTVVTTLIFLSLIYLGLWYLVNSNFGLRMQAMRDDQLAAETRGVDIRSCKLLAFTTSSAIMALAGAIFACQTRYVSPDMLNMDYSFQFIVMGLFGGINTLVGPIAGAFCITFLLEFLRSWEAGRLIVLGLLVCVNIIALPDGLIGTFWRYWKMRGADLYLRQRFKSST